MSTVLAIQHVQGETLGAIADTLSGQGIAVDAIRTFDGQRIPTGMGGADALIVLGGPMGVYEQDRHPFLRDEIRLIEEALRDETPVLGICLGSQLLASALGAKVTKGKRKEIGWHPIRLTEAGMSDPLWTGLDPSFTAYHWHGDVFEVPSGTVSLASSDLTECQAFRYGRHAYGVLFHMETTRPIIEDMIATFAEELGEAGIDGREILERTGDHLPQLQRIGRTVFHRWAGFITPR
ncbi:MAG: gamma-glutamyl-gamma-aminobutyrate hydrolase family protein [Nitrospirae bacterium]|nr:gamma-glutamyl-gamma-aminobutyrate hydrolase family protein [Nitrospirota bacterium]